MHFKKKYLLAIPVAIVIAWAWVSISIARLFADRSAETRFVELDGLKVAVWTPPKSAKLPAPVILFSHGFHGCSIQSTFLTTALAARGFIVFAPNHRDATCAGGESTWFDRSVVPLQAPEVWNDTSYRDRKDDIDKLIAAIAASKEFGPESDLSRIGLVGHSLGGYTVLGLAGAWPSWKIKNVKAVLALSPYDQPFIDSKSLGGLDAPVMYQGGTLDFGITPSIDRVGGGYDESPAPKYMIIFKYAGHFAWTDIQATFQDEIDSYSIDFLEHYVVGAPAPKSMTTAGPQVSTIRFDVTAR